MQVLKLTALVIFTLVILFALFLLYSTLSWYNPPEKLTLAENNRPDTIRCDSTLHVLSWNIGYAGLGENMDFFYDGGKSTRDTKEQTLVNLNAIHEFIKSNATADFMLIQEIDVDSRRSYYLNEMDTLLRNSPCHASLAPNYKSWFVPVPLTAPMGKVNSGILSLSRYLPENSVRYAYPGKFGWPNRLFNLRRCMLVNRYPTNNGKELLVINTHMSAFDDGSLKKQEMQYLRDFILAEYSGGNYIVVGGDWNQSPPDFPLAKFGEPYHSESFILSNIARDFMPAGWTWAYDPLSPTNRYLNSSYIPGSTFRCLIDHYLVSPNVEVLQNSTFDLNFKNSDHNPIRMSFMLKK